MQNALPIFVAVATAFAGAAILTCILQFFADGWQLPTRKKLQDMPDTLREERRKQMPIVFIICFLVVLLTLALCWRIGGMP